MNEQELFEFKKKVDRAKSNVSELKGRQQYQMKTLKDEWGCNSIEQAKKTVEDGQKKIEQFDQKIDEGTRELEEKYDA